MEHRLSRSLATALIALLAILASALPLRAEGRRLPAGTASLARLSPASLQMLGGAAPATATAPQGSTSSNTSFFTTRKGVTAIALMAAGTVLTVWSINHDRQPVKSPIR